LSISKGDALQEREGKGRYRPKEKEGKKGEGGVRGGNKSKKDPGLGSEGQKDFEFGPSPRG